MAYLPGNAILRPVTYPSELSGKSNGKLPSSIMATVKFPGGGTGIFCKTAARAFTAMLAEMARLKFKMMSVSSYRSYEQQVTLWNQRYYIVSYNSGIYWNGHYWVKRAGVATAAKPGTSNHGWGLADDMGENLDADSAVESISQTAVNWLTLNADKYGISAELRSEAWHWRYYRGDSIPKAVLDYEASIKPKPPLEEDDVLPYLMIAADAGANQGAVYACFGGSGNTRWLGPNEFSFLKAPAPGPAVPLYRETDLKTLERLENARVDKA
jgi:hypothetical protein